MKELLDALDRWFISRENIMSIEHIAATRNLEAVYTVYLEDNVEVPIHFDPTLSDDDRKLIDSVVVDINLI